MLVRSMSTPERHEPGEYPHEHPDDYRVAYRDEGGRVDPVEDLWEHPVAPHGEQDARLAVERHERHAEDRDDRPSGEHGGRPGRPGDVAQDHREARRLALEVLVALRTDRGDRHEDVDGGHYDGREEDRQGERPAGVVHLLAGRRDGVQADEGEEDRRRGHADAGDPEGRERREVIPVETP